MKRRFFSFLLAAALLLGLCPGPARAAEAPSLEDVIAEQFEAFAVPMATEQTQQDAGTYMTNHAVGKDTSSALLLPSDHPFTVAALNANLYLTTFPKAAAAAVRHMHAFGMDEIYLRGGLGWYTHRMTHGVSRYADNGNEDLEDDFHFRSVWSSGTFTEKPNSYDNLMMLLVGSAGSRITMKEASSTADTVTYDVSIEISDRFDFENDYTGDQELGSDTSLAEFLTILGQQMELRAFDWSVTADFRLTVPFSCEHTCGSYRWDFDGEDMTACTDGGFTENAVTRYVQTLEDGSQGNPYFKLAKTVRLIHSAPWVVELVCKGSGTVLLAPDRYISAGHPFLLRTMTDREDEDGLRYDHYIFGGEYYGRHFSEEEQEALGLESSATFLRHHYGVDYTDLYSSRKTQTFVLENIVAEDGTNRIRLTVDGVDCGFLTDHYYSDYYVTNELQGQDSWLTGKDLYLNYIGNANYGLNRSLQSLTVWENGKDGGGHYDEGTVTAPTCTEQGFTERLCPICGYAYQSDPTPAAGHRFDGCFRWSDDHREAVLAPGSCSACGLSQTGAHCTVTADFPSSGEMVFTARAQVEDQTVTDVRRFCLSREEAAAAVTLPDGLTGLTVFAAARDSQGRMTGLWPLTEPLTSLPLPDGSLSVFLLQNGSLAPVLPPLQLP